MPRIIPIAGPKKIHEGWILFVAATVYSGPQRPHKDKDPTFWF